MFFSERTQLLFSKIRQNTATSQMLLIFLWNWKQIKWSRNQPNNHVSPETNKADFVKLRIILWYKSNMNHKDVNNLELTNDLARIFLLIPGKVRKSSWYYFKLLNFSALDVCESICFYPWWSIQKRWSISIKECLNHIFIIYTVFFKVS